MTRYLFDYGYNEDTDQYGYLLQIKYGNPWDGGWPRDVLKYLYYNPELIDVAFNWNDFPNIKDWEENFFNVAQGEYDPEVLDLIQSWMGKREPREITWV